jgi:hypothetical protein
VSANPRARLGARERHAQRPRASSKRQHVRDPDARVEDRSTSSLAIIARRVRAIAEAQIHQDESVLRGELLALTDEAALLARQPVLIESPLRARLRIAAERDPSGRGGSS